MSEFSLPKEHSVRKPFVQLFSGVDGFRLALERSDWKCVWSNELDKYCCMVSRFHYGDGELVEGDIREVDAKQIPDHMLLCAGFPCQTFSIAGKRKALGESRGTLFTHILRVASVKRPLLLLLENVKGLLSSDSGRTFATIIRSLGNLGYLLEWQVLNSKYFGVPQNRERVFIIGHLRKGSFKPIFPIGESNGCPSEKPKSKDICPSITSRYYKRGKTDPYICKQNDVNEIGNIFGQGQEGRVFNPDGIAPSLRRHESGGNYNPLILQEHSHSGKDGKGRGFREYREIVPALTQQMGTGGNNVPMVMPCLTPDRINKRQHGRRFKENGEPSFTLTGQDIHGVAIANCLNTEDSRKFKLSPNSEQKANLVISNAVDCDGYLRETSHHDKSISQYRIRRLTPVECERLQGFPDNWTLQGKTKDGKTVEISDTQRYKMMGNAVTTNVVTFLGEKLLGCLV